MKSEVLKENFFLHRLSNLQALCSSSNSELPNALVFVPGLDGKQNKGSFMILKYLFQGSVGRDIYEASLDEELDCLEEMVLIIQESSISVFWSNAAKAVVGPILNTFPFVLEYCPTEEEEENVDQFEARKCNDFKRMMLESVSEGGVVGLPVPLGYDDVLDTENWPLLQSFAVDTVLCATGFFTSRYAVIDITETLDIMFCTIDGYYVEKAISVLQTNVLSHMDQVMAPLRNSHGPEQRRCIKASEIISPLQMLFEFGSLDTAFPVDPVLQPVLYLGAEDASHALGGTITNQKWTDTTVGTSMSAIIEAYEPSTGMRWCRTYFLQRGKCLDKILDPEALVNNDGKEGDEGTVGDMPEGSEHTLARGVVVNRMEELHQKLCTCFRIAVKTAFSEHADVLDAGGTVQEMMHGFMTGEDKLHDSVSLNDVKLRPCERLQVHMDCLNAHGQVVGIEDVDDMGGQCWTYIRVSVHGITGVAGSNETHCVATGDTFLFSSFFSPLRLQTGTDGKHANKALSICTHMQDAFCLTHSIPRTAYVLGPDEEEVMARRFIASTGSIHMISTLGLGGAINTSGTGIIGVTMLTDNPSSPVLSIAVRLFTSGFVVEKIDKCYLPFLVSFGVHVKEMWTVNMGDCYRRALDSKCFKGVNTSSVVDIPEGLLVVLQYRDFSDEANSKGSDERSPSVKSCIEYNMLDRILPSSGKVRFVAFCLFSDSSRHLTALSDAHHAWRVAARVNDIPDNRGAGVNQTPLPDEILGPFLAMIDAEGARSVADTESLDVALSDENKHFIAGTVQIPGSGYLTMRANFMMAENARLSQPPSDNSVDEYSESKHIEEKSRGNDNMWTDLIEEDQCAPKKKHVVIVMGTAGSGVLANASQVLNRLNDTDKENSSKVQHVSSTLVVIDLTHDFPERVTRKGIIDILARTDSQNVVVCLLTSAAGHVSVTSIISKIEACGCTVSYSVAIIASPSVEKHLQSHPSINGLGFEAWAAAGKELMCCGVADFIMFIEQSKAPSSKSLDDLFRSLNHNSVSARMQPGQLWLDDETVDAITASLTNTRRRNSYGRSRRLNSAALVKRIPHTFPHCRGLRSYCINLPVSFNRWDLEKLEGVMKRILFPSAAISNTCPNEQWAIPPNERGLVGMARCIELAKVKVFASRQTEIGRSIFSEYLDSIQNSPGADSVRSGILSVHACLTSKIATDEASVFFEATSGAVIIRKWSGEMMSASSRDVLCVQGIFSSKDLDLLEEVIAHCTPYSLPEKHVMTTADLTPEDRKQVQLINSELRVPEGWWFDGSSFVDVHGKRSAERPDTDHLNDLFIEKQNGDIIKYNKLFREVKMFL